MTSRGSDRSPNGHVAGQRLAAHPLPVPSQHRSSTKKHSHRDPKSSKSKATYSRSRLDQDEESDDARCPSDVSMEDGSEETLSKASPSAQADGVGKSTDVDSKSGGPFIGKLQGMIKKEPGYIRWAEEGSDAILIPNDKIFVAKALHKHFGKIKMESFEKQLRNYGYQKKKTIMGAEGAGSLWVQKEMPLPDDPIPPDLAQERPPAASVAPRPSAQADLEARMDALQNTLNMVLSMLNASMASRPSGRPDLEARIDELQNTLNTVLSELSANKSEQKETRDILSNIWGGVKALTTMFMRVFSGDTEEPSSAGSGSSHPVPNSGPRPAVAHGPSQMNQAGGYGGIPNWPSLPPQTSADGVAAPQEAPFGPEIPPPCNPFGPAFPSVQPAHPQLFDYGFKADLGIPGAFPGGQFNPEDFWMQDSDIAMLQGAENSYGYPQTPDFATGVSSFPAPAPRAPAHTQPSNHFGSSGGPRNPVAYVQPMANPNTSNHGPQAQYAR